MRLALVLSLVVLVGAPARAEAPLTAAAKVAKAATQADPFTIAEAGRLTIAVPHHYALAEAITRLTYLLTYWKTRFNIVSEWRGDRVFLSGAVYGVKVQAVFLISDSEITGFAADPGWPWRGQVSGYVDRKLKKYLHPNYDEP